MSDDFPAELRQFIAQHIESLAQLEAMLRLRQDAGRQWQATDMARELYISGDMAAGLLGDLVRRGFATSEGDKFLYAPTNPNADRMLEQLAAVYQERRVAVITEIYSNPIKKVQTFADAFRLRREE